ncbi:hypothetical protein [Zunongwangia pacifica]|uniref:Uncharacterized protein n=1 Tax=Zunongwangia pacifica TaxID=2911062 RepID=A0A9X2CN49_9FLAO|nr:hypothetical protein [Zunongwangia pacifica]MCL6218189.1 hypothetical protein [Zunongwangia pacifica]
MEQFLQEIFKKAKEESGEESLRKWAEHISDYLMEENRFQLSGKTLERYYNGETTPNGEKKNQLATYIGYASYRDYLITQHKEDQTEEVENMISLKVKSKKKVLTTLLVIFPVLFGIGYLGFSTGREECMVWKEDHFEIAACSGELLEEEWNEYRLENFKKIEVNPETEFFDNGGRPKIWYDKENNIFTYFTAPGINPETEQTVKQITPYIIQTHIMNKK